MAGGGGSPKQPAPAQRAAAAQPVMRLLSQAEERNNKFAMALLTQDWFKPPTLGIPQIDKKNVLGL